MVRKSLPIHSRQIARLREEQGMLRSELALAAGTHTSTITNAEKGSEPDLATLRRIADALGVRLRDLVDPD